MSIKNFLSRYKTFLIPFLFVLIVIRIFLLQLPLFQNLDLEISIVYALIFFVLSSFGGLYFRNKSEKVLEILSFYSIIIITLFISFLVIDAIVIKCPLTFGILFFPIFTVNTILFGFSIALILSSLEKCLSWFLLALVTLAFIVYSLLVYYFEPQLFLFNPLIVFFPGLVYNEIFEIDSRILIYTGFLSFSSFLIILNYHFKEISNQELYRKFGIHLKIIPFFILIFLYIFSDKMDLSTSQKKLNEHFTFSIKGQNFEIFLENPYQQIYDRQVLLSTVEFHYRELEKLTKKSPSEIKIYIFKDDLSKRNLLGDEVADFTKPWLKQIFVTEKSFHETIKHELAHIFLGEISDNIFKVASNLNLGLIEGGAMALEWEWLEKSPYYYAALINRFIGKFEAKDFFKNYSFATKQSYVSYLISGSFCKYLIDKYGIEKFLEFYRTGKFGFIYEKNLEDEFQNFISQLPNSNFNESDSIKARALFGGKNLFNRDCPRALARITRKGIELINKQNLNKAEKLFENVYRKTGDLEAFLNLLRTKFYQKKYNEVVSLYSQSNFKNLISGLSSIRTSILYALSLIKLGEYDEARKLFMNLKKLNISSGWNAYIEMMSLLIDYPELVDLMSEKTRDSIKYLLQSEIQEKWIILKNYIDYISNEELNTVVQNSVNDFWLLRKSFYRYLQLGNFVGAQKVIEIINQNRLISNEVEKYQFDLMRYIVQRIKLAGYNTK